MAEAYLTRILCLSFSALGTQFDAKSCSLCWVGSVSVGWGQQQDGAEADP